MEEIKPIEATESIIERAEKLNKETKEAEARILDHRKAIEEITARSMLAGRSNAGTNVVVDKEAEEKAKINAWLKNFGRQI